MFCEHVKGSARETEVKCQSEMITATRNADSKMKIWKEIQAKKVDLQAQLKALREDNDSSVTSASKDLGDIQAIKKQQTQAQERYNFLVEEKGIENTYGVKKKESDLRNSLTPEQ